MPATTQVLEGLWQINLGAVNAFLIDSGGLTLIDTGTPNSEGKIVAAIESIGKQGHRPRALRITTKAAFGRGTKGTKAGEPRRYEDREGRICSVRAA